MVMSDWRKACALDTEDSLRPTLLRYMVRNNIESGTSANKTMDMIDVANKRTKGDPAKVNTFRRDPAIPGITADELAAYRIMACTNHGHRVLLMLPDYPATIKNIRIGSFSVTTPATIGAGKEYSIVM
jgi:hypothetical protein